MVRCCRCCPHTRLESFVVDIDVSELVRGTVKRLVELSEVVLAGVISARVLIFFSMIAFRVAILFPRDQELPEGFTVKSHVRHLVTIDCV